MHFTFEYLLHVCMYVCVLVCKYLAAKLGQNISIFICGLITSSKHAPPPIPSATQSPPADRHLICQIHWHFINYALRAPDLDLVSVLAMIMTFDLPGIGARIHFGPAQAAFAEGQRRTWRRIRLMQWRIALPKGSGAGWSQAFQGPWLATRLGRATWANGAGCRGTAGSRGTTWYFGVTFLGKHE